MLISIRHQTRYTYDAPAKYAIQTLRLTPPSFVGQTVKHWKVTAPGMENAVHFTDSFGNAASLVAYNQLHTGIEIVASGLVETVDCAGVVKGLNDPSPNRIYLRQTPATTPDGAIRELAASTHADTILARLHALMDAIRARVDYETGSTSQLTPAADVLAQGKGVCQDHAHVFIAAVRSLGIPARYVNGYFLSGAESPEAAHHAWAEAYVEHLGWVGFDVANLVCPDDRFVRLATGLDSASASPIRGSRPIPTGATHAKETLDVHVDVVDQTQLQSQSQSQSGAGDQQQQQQQSSPPAKPPVAAKKGAPASKDAASS